MLLRTPRPVALALALLVAGCGPRGAVVLDDEPAADTDADTDPDTGDDSGGGTDTSGDTDTGGDTGGDTDAPLDPAPRTLDPWDAAVHVTGRADDSDPTRLPMHWPGTAFAVRFEAPSITVTIEDEGDNYLNVHVDGAAPVVLDLLPGVHDYVLAEGLAPGEHHIAVDKRTETFEGDAVVSAITLGAGNRVLPADPAPTLRLEFYGDSITAGYSADCACNEDVPEYKNHGATYATLVAEALGGEHHAIALSGVGLVRSWWDAEMPDYWDGLRAGDGAWDFADWPADIVVVNLGQNDYWLGVRGEIVRAYVGFLADVRAAHPDAEIFLALGSMDATAPGSPMPAYVEAAVEARRDAGDTDVHAVIFAYNGWGGHPVADDHAAMAEALVEAIDAAMPELR